MKQIIVPLTSVDNHVCWYQYLIKQFIFSAGTSAPVFQFASHTSWVTTVKWHDKSSFHLLSASYDGKVMLWDLRTAVIYPYFNQVFFTFGVIINLRWVFNQ